jgi:hypothetical protein
MTIDIASQFSKVPAGRYYSDGPFSGQAFREKLLLPALSKEERVVILLDGGKGYGSSFLEEAFGGLVREENIGENQIKQKLQLQSADPSLIDEIWLYINTAAKKKA